MAASVGNQSDSDGHFKSRLLRWMNAQPVLMSFIVEAKKRWYHQEGRYSTLENSNESSSNGNYDYQPIGHTIKVERFGYGQSNPTYRVTVLPCFTADHHTATALESPLITFVLRSKPKSVIHSSAHAIHREYAILSAIQQYNRDIMTNTSLCSDALTVPVPTVYVYCHDTSIIGTSFYIMEFMSGRICTDPSLQDHFDTPHERQQAYQHVIHILALIHIIDLSKYIDYDMLLHGGISGSDRSKSVHHSNNKIITSKPNNIGALNATVDVSASNGTVTSRTKRNFIERQLFQLANVSQRQSFALQQQQQEEEAAAAAERNSQQSRESILKMMQPLDSIMKGLESYAPFCPGCSHPIMAKRWKQSGNKSNEFVTSSTNANTPSNMLIHGDYKIDNIIFHPTLPKVIAIIDWELASMHNDGVDPYCDVANLCMMYFIPKQIGKSKSNDSNTTVITGIADYSNHEIQSLGVPLREELIRIYCNERDKLLATFDSYPSWNVSASLRRHDYELIYDWSGYYLTFLFFKNCVILQGVLQRTLQSASRSVIPDTNSSDTIHAITHQQQQVRKKTQLLLRLLPITIKLTTAIWETYPPPSLSSLVPFSGGTSNL
jgi:aminoglycoside phosphotransferase (APT) family kinase protein